MTCYNMLPYSSPALTHEPEGADQCGFLGLRCPAVDDVHVDVTVPAKHALHCAVHCVPTGAAWQDWGHAALAVGLGRPLQPA